jgi:hypothetical protein
MSAVLPTGLGILGSGVRFDQFQPRSRRDTLAVGHRRDWKQSLTAGGPALIVVEALLPRVVPPVAPAFPMSDFSNANPRLFRQGAFKKWA